CASGGGRNDLESLRRGVPILRSDNDRTSTALRLSITTSFNKWIPFCGAITREKEEQLSLLGKSDVYVWRASYLPSLNIDARFVHEPDMDYDLLRFGINEWKKVKPYLLKEFYTLTPWHSEDEKDSFTAYTYFDPETECGVLFVFRQEECETDKIEIELPFDTSAMLTDVDTQKQFIAENGIFTACLDKKRTAKLYFYKLK
ncbi:MAG: hypothetical protein J6B23_06170, partial [Clostridia bacterium]|nr:hypothetical protein [Clostridia bacterium]